METCIDISLGFCVSFTSTLTVNIHSFGDSDSGDSYIHVIAKYENKLYFY